MASALGVWVCVSVCACLGLCVLVRELSVCDEVVCGAKGCLCGNGIACCLDTQQACRGFCWLLRYSLYNIARRERSGIVRLSTQTQIVLE